MDGASLFIEIIQHAMGISLKMISNIRARIGPVVLFKELLRNATDTPLRRAVP